MKTFRLFFLLLIPFGSTAQAPSPEMGVVCTLDTEIPMSLRFINIETDAVVKLKLDNSNHQLEDISSIDIRRMHFDNDNHSTYGSDVISSGRDLWRSIDSSQEFLVILTLDPWICSKKAVKRELTFTYTTDHGTKGSLCVPITTDFHMPNDTVVSEGDSEYTYKRGELIQLRRFGEEDVLLLELFYKKGKCVKAVEYDREKRTATTILYKDGTEISREEKPLED